MLALRNNLVQYVHLIDIYGPCIVGASNWNKTDNMERYCGNNASLFNDRVLSLSDEAFLLVVLINYTAEWMWKIEMETIEVRAFTQSHVQQFCYLNSPIVLFTDTSQSDWDSCSGRHEQDASGTFTSTMRIAFFSTCVLTHWVIYIIRHRSILCLVCHACLHQALPVSGGQKKE